MTATAQSKDAAKAQLKQIENDHKVTHIAPTRYRAKNTKGASYRKKLKNADEAMNVLRMHMHTWDYKDLAEAVGVSYSCIMSIRSGRTKWPRPKTFFNLIDVLELEMYLVAR